MSNSFLKKIFRCIKADIRKYHKNLDIRIFEYSEIFRSKQIIKLVIQLKRINYQILLTFRIFASCQPLLNALTYCFSFFFFLLTKTLFPLLTKDQTYKRIRGVLKLQSKFTGLTFCFSFLVPFNSGSD